MWISPLKKRGKGLLFINVTLLLSQDVKIRYSSKKKLHDWQRKKCMSGHDSVYSVIDWMIVNNIPALTQVNTSSEMSFRGSYFDKGCDEFIIYYKHWEVKCFFLISDPIG